MRTTLDIDDAILAAARAIARDEGVSIGTALSRLARKGLAAVAPATRSARFPTFPVAPHSRPVTLDIVNVARDED